MRTLLLVAAAVAVLTSPARGYDGNTLHEKCEGFQTTSSDIENAARWSWCLGYLSGVIDTNLYRYTLAKTDYRVSGTNAQNERWCIYYPEDVVYSQWTAVVAKYLADNPKERHEDAHVLVTRALQAAWPCK